MKNAESLQELLTDNLRDLYDAEKQLTKALPKLAKSAENELLAKGINEHLEETKKQAERLEKIFEMLGEEPRSKPCAGMKGIIEEGEEHLSEGVPEGLVDAVLISGSRKVEHYEMVAYASAIELADAAGKQNVGKLLRQTFAEEERMDKKLAQLSARLLKQPAREAA
jgi:ferritin-like metal-binding protein YciE